MFSINFVKGTLVVWDILVSPNLLLFCGSSKSLNGVKHLPKRLTLWRRREDKTFIHWSHRLVGVGTPILLECAALLFLKALTSVRSRPYLRSIGSCQRWLPPKTCTLGTSKNCTSWNARQLGKRFFLERCVICGKALQSTSSQSAAWCFFPYIPSKYHLKREHPQPAFFFPQPVWWFIHI